MKKNNKNTRPTVQTGIKFHVGAFIKMSSIIIHSIYLGQI